MELPNFRGSNRAWNQSNENKMCVDLSSEHYRLDNFSQNVKDQLDENTQCQANDWDSSAQFIDQDYQGFCGKHKGGSDRKQRTSVQSKIGQLYKLASQVSDKILTLKCNIAYYDISEQEATDQVADLEQEYDSLVYEVYTMTDIPELKDIQKSLEDLLQQCKEQEKVVEDLKNDNRLNYMKSMIMDQLDQGNSSEGSSNSQTKFKFTFQLENKSQQSSQSQQISKHDNEDESEFEEPKNTRRTKNKRRLIVYDEPPLSKYSDAFKMLLIFVIFMLSWTLFDENNKDGIKAIRKLSVGEIILGLDVNIPIFSKSDSAKLLDNLQNMVHVHKFGKDRFAEITIVEDIGEDEFKALIDLHKRGHVVNFKNKWFNQKWANFIADNIPQKDIISVTLNGAVKYSKIGWKYIKGAFRIV